MGLMKVGDGRDANGDLVPERASFEGDSLGRLKERTRGLTCAKVLSLGKYTQGSTGQYV